MVVRSRRGVEIGSIMREAAPDHARLLAGTYVGEILRPADADDLANADRLQHKAEGLFERGRRIGASLRLPIEIFDAEILLDGQSGILYVHRSDDCDPRRLLDALSECERLAVTMHDLGPAPSPTAADTIVFGSCSGGGCGEGGCGSCQKGTCSTCKIHSHEGKVSAVAAPAPFEIGKRIESRLSLPRVQSAALTGAPT
jgi:hypothetical protein